MSIVRRIGSRILKLLRNESGDPVTESARVQVYAKDVSGIGRLFARDTNGDVTQLTPGGGGGGGAEIFSQTPTPNGPSPSMQFQALGIKPDGSTVYVGAQAGPEVWRFNTTTNKWITTAPSAIALNYPTQFVFSPDGSKMYVRLLSDTSTIYIVNTTTNLVTGTVTGLPGGNYQAMAIQPGTNELWAHYDAGPNWVARIDTTTDTYITSFTAATGNSYDMKFTPDGTKMYYLGADTLSFDTRFHIYDATTYTLITSISDTPLYRSLAMLPDGSEVWVSIDGSFPTNSSIVRYSTTTDSIVGTPILTSQDAGAPFHMVANPDGSKVYALLFSGDIDVITVSSHTITNTIAMSGEFAGDLIINPAGTRLYASKTQGTKPYWVKVISTATELVTTTITSADVTVPAPTDEGSFSGLRFVGVSVTDDGGGVAAITPPVVFDAGSAPLMNIKANRPGAGASISDQTKTGQTNLGSGSTTAADYATVGGGVEGEARGIASVVPGGTGNIARGDNSFAMGEFNEAEGQNSAAFGGSLTGPLAEGSFATNSSNVEGIWSTTVGYAGVGENAEACFGGCDGFVDEGSYGCSALGGAYAGEDGTYNHVEGEASVDNGCRDCHAEGRFGFIGPNLTGAHVEGKNGDCEADFAHCEGEDCEIGVGAYASHAEGGGCTASGPNAHAEGTSSEASGYYAHAEGGATLASGEGAHSEGDGGIAQADWSHTQGSRALGVWETSHNMGHGYSGGFGSGDGTSQSGNVGYRLYTIAGPTNTAPLRFGVNSGGATALPLQDGRVYDFMLTAIVVGSTAGPTYKQRTLKIKFNARCVAGTAVIVGTGTAESYGDAATWTITPSVSTNTIIFTFDTGSDTDTCYISARLDYVLQRFI